MTQEEKQLLLIDLCAREPYHPMINVFNQGYNGFKDGEFDTSLWLNHIDAFRFDRIEVLPYLLPMSSMTKEEKIELCTISYAPDEMKTIEEKLYVIKTNAENAADFYNKHHFDYRGLIDKGLALEAPEGMYKI